MRQHSGFGLLVGLSALLCSRARGADRIDYRYEDYSEDSGRIHIRTHGAFFEKVFDPRISLKGNYVYDGISGATPTGAPPIPGSDTVRKVSIEDIRRAGFLEPSFKSGRHTFTPQLSLSIEKDYESRGLSFTHAMELNEKNTTLSWGVSHAFDRLIPNFGTSNFERQHKDTTDVLLGLNQVLGPRTVLMVNLTLGYSSGFLSDPYKRVLFDDFYTAFNPYNPGDDWTVQPEQRPEHKFRQVLYGALRHAVPQVNGAFEVNYRLHHDDFGVLGNTVGLEWHERFVKWITVSPLFRFHTQTAADFYGSHFPGDPSCTLPPPFCTDVPAPTYYSADYRLSAMRTFTYGVTVSGKLGEHATLDFGYKRYTTHGTDASTAQDTYPQATVFTGGFTLWF
jgi:Protein of unknown function (DUF3570)